MYSELLSGFSNNVLRFIRNVATCDFDVANWCWPYLRETRDVHLSVVALTFTVYMDCWLFQEGHSIQYC